MTFSSALPAGEIPDVDFTTFVLGHARDRGDRPAIIDGPSGRTVSYAELARSVQSVAAGLAERDFGRGDTACVCLPNGPEFPVVLHGVLAAGGRCTTANPLYTAGELARQLTETDASILVGAPAFVEVAREAAARAGCELYVMGEATDGHTLSELLGDPDAAPRRAIEPDEEIAAILYSGGTTGLPKGVMLSHRNLVANLARSVPAFGLTSDDVVLALLPFFHVYGLNVILSQALVAGATVVTMPRYDLAQLLDLLERYRITRGYVVPPIVLALANDPAVEGCDLSALRHLLTAAAPISPDVLEACERRLGCRMSQAYGMTEMSSATHAAPPFGAERRPGSVGPPIPGTECRLVDPDTGEDVEPGQPGELWLRGEHVMRGYLGNPEATAAMIDPDGWLRTGDIAVVEDGWFTVVARIKEIIKCKGYQVAPAELEAILLGHPQVADCAVIGVPDEAAGEVPKVFVVPAGDELDMGSVLRFVSDRVAPYKRIRAFEIIDEIPKSPSGRILRRVLEERGHRTAGEGPPGVS
jgi:acyl-CoA synthetase (AMP-forming)/AMP-acid ligase II